MFANNKREDPKLRRSGPHLVLGAIFVLGLAAAHGVAVAADVGPFNVALPTVTGPIPSTADNFAATIDGFDVMPPVPSGYVEEEYFFSGTGNLYEYTPTGIEIVTPCPASATLGCTNIPYTTRMIVKRPADASGFSGTVVVEPLNPSANYDIAAVWDRSLGYFVRRGDIFVGWTSKSVVVNTLQAWNPTRYADLNWPYAPFTPGGNSGVYDGITFDIAAQIGALFKANGPGSPLQGYNVKHVIEAGFSQDGSFTFTQADIFHNLEMMPNGGTIYDGYVPGGTTGPSDINFGLTPAGALPAGDPRHQMQPRNVPVVHINTETEIALGAPTAPAGLAYRRPDSDAPDDRYRLWEVPGASHVSNDFSAPVITLQLGQAEISKIPVSDLPPLGCTHMEYVNGPVTGVPGVVDPNTFPFAYVANAAFADLKQWIDFSLPPPRADRIELTNTTPAQIARDQFGNALGGVRTPYLDVPTATHVPTDSAAETTALSGFCVLYGYDVPFDESELDSLYRNHFDYVYRFAADGLQVVLRRFWLEPDAQAAVATALQAQVP